MIEKERLIWIYKTMNRIRSFEHKALELFEKNMLRGSVHLYVGQEAIASTICSLLNDTDYITSTHRGHGHCIAKGAELNGAMAELMGKETGCCKGRGGSMHIADLTKGNLGANAMVGGGIPIAVGAALAAHLRETDQVAVSFFGDGASNQGIFHEAINLAALWKLPVIFVCENNGFGISVPLEKSTSVEDVGVRGSAYGIPGYIVDGNDVFEIDQAMQKALKRAKGGKGPSLIECKTYRWYGHWIGDPQVYRTKEQVEEWKKECPIERLRKYLFSNKVLGKEEIENIETKAGQEVEAAVEFAVNSPEPDPVNVLQDVFFEECRQED